MSPIPSSPAVFIVDAADFAEHLEAGSWSEASTSEKLAAVQFAELGQSPDSQGVYGAKNASVCPAGGCHLDARILIVAQDPKQFLVGGVPFVQATNFFVASMHTSSIAVGWYATPAAFSFKQNAAGVAGSRCCDRGQRCTATGPVPGSGGDDCTDSYCGAWLNAGELPAGTDTSSQRTAVGMPTISAQLYPASSTGISPLSLECLPAPGGPDIAQVAPPGCGVSLSVCSPETVAIQPPERFWTATLDGTGCLAGTSRPVTGRAVPKGCQYAGAMTLPDECAGHCESCLEWSKLWDSFSSGHYVPPMCAVAKVDGANSSVCLQNPDRDAQVAAFTNEMQARTNNCHSTSGNCCGEGCLCEAAGPNGNRICQQCDATSCHQVVLPPRYDPYANTTSAPADSACAKSPDGCPLTVTDCGSGTCITTTIATPAAKSPQPVSATNASPTAGLGGGGGGGQGGGGGGGGGVNPAPGGIRIPDLADERPQTRAKGTDNAMQASASGAKTKKADPISLLSGSFEYSSPDLTFPGPVHPLTFTRRYSSASAQRSPLGSNWGHNWDVRLELLRESNAPSWTLPYCAGTGDEDIRCVLLHGSDGSQRVFFFDEKTRLYMPQAGSTDTVMRVFNYPWGAGNAEGIEAAHWALRTSHGDLLTFDLQGYLTEMRDRFGNGFRITQEDTPFYTLWKDCKATVTSTIPQGCRLLDSLTGHKGLSDERIVPELPNGFQLSMGLHAQDEAYFNALFATAPLLGRSAFGIRLKRPIEVEDDLGRKLTFVYSTPTSASWKTYSPTAPWAHLLVEVHGPAGTKVLFDYGRPPATQLPSDFNESFLISSTRQDTSGISADVSPSLSRVSIYTYDWNAAIGGVTFPSGDPVGVSGTLFNQYKAYFASFIGCNGVYKEQCGNLVRPWFNNLDPTELARTSAFNIAADVWDNIVAVRVDGVLESATRYNTNPSALDFDRALEQRYGSRQWEAAGGGPQPPSSAFTWTSEEAQLPLATFTYVEAGPLQNPTTLGAHTDRTEGGAIPSAIASRYALEATPGGGLPDHSPLDIGHSTSNGKPRCEPSQTEALRRALPGHAPSYPYFAPPGFQGTFNPDLSLLRARHTCNQIAERQLSNPFHNDTLSTLEPWYLGVGSGTSLPPGHADGTFRDVSRHSAKRLAGQRDAVAQDANRICQWTSFVDRDGDLTWYGLNFQGQALVEAEALRSAPTTFRYTERRFNADGSLVLETRPTLGSAIGSTKYVYEEIRPDGNGGNDDNLPAWWTRRKNLVRRTTTVTTAVTVESESSPGTFSTVASEYTAFRYEPLYNQLLTAESGTRAAGAGQSDVWHSRTSWMQDYQELSTSGAGGAVSIVPILDALRPWGYDWATSGGSYDFSAILSWQLPVVLHSQDMNGDGWAGFPLLATTGTARGKGVPIRVLHQVPGSSVVVDEVLQWNSAGRLARQRDGNGGETRWSYYPLKDGSGAGIFGAVTAPTTTTANLSERGFLAQLSERRAPAGDAFAGFGVMPCSYLKGPYQYLLPSTCSSTPASDLAAKGLPTSTVAAILAASNDGPAAFAVSQFSYNQAGHIRYTWADGQQGHVTTDADGRPIDVTAADGVVTHHIYSSLGLSQLYRYKPGEYLHGEKYLRDDSGRELAACVEAVGGACAGFPATLRPTNAVVNETTYTREGLVRRTIGPDLAHAEYTYDERGLVIGLYVHVPSDTTFEGRRRLLSYDNDGNLVSEWAAADAAGASPLVSRYWYRDSFGRPWSHHDGRVTWNTMYSARGLMTEIRESTASAWTVRPQWNALGLEVGRKLNGVLMSETLRTPTGMAVGTRRWGQTAWEYYATPVRAGQLWHKTPTGSHTLTVFNPSTRESHAVEVPNTGTAQVEIASLDPVGRTLATTQVGGGRERTMTYERNSAGFVSLMTDVNGFQTQHTRNLLGWDLIVEKQRGDGEFASQSYANFTASGRPTVVTDSNGEEVTYSYSALGELRSQSGPGVAYRTWGHDRMSRVTSAGRSTQQSGTMTVYQYDGTDLQSITSDGTTHTTFEYDVLGRLVGSTYSNPRLSNFLVAADREVKTVLEYDNLGNTLYQKQKVGGHAARQVKTNWRLHASGYLEMVRETPNSIWNHTEWLETYDASGRLSSRLRTGGGTAASQLFAYAGDQLVGRTQHSGLGGSPLRQTLAYDEFHQVVENTYRAIDLDGQGEPVDQNEANAYCDSGFWGGQPEECYVPAFKEELLRGNDGRVHSWKSIHGFPSAMGTQRTSWMGAFYGAAGELQRHFEEWLPYGGPSTEGYAPGQVITSDDVADFGASISADPWEYSRDWRSGSVNSVTHPSRGQRLEVRERLSGYRQSGLELGSSNYSSEYDDDGAATEVAGRSLKWGPNGELAKAESPGGTEYYLYDAFGRLAATHNGSQVKQTFSWDGDQMVAAFNGSGASVWEVSWGPGVDNLVEYRRFDATSATDFAVITDQRHSVVAAMDAATRQSADLIIRYTPEGLTFGRDSNDDDACDEPLGYPCPLPAGMPFGFNSAWRSDTTQLIYMRNRWYSPHSGEFLSHDPLGPIDSVNLYAFASFDPLNAWDPFGLAPVEFNPLNNFFNRPPPTPPLPPGVKPIRLMRYAPNILRPLAADVARQAAARAAAQAAAEAAAIRTAARLGARAAAAGANRVNFVTMFIFPNEVSCATRLCDAPEGEGIGEEEIDWYPMGDPSPPPLVQIDPGNDPEMIDPEEPGAGMQLGGGRGSAESYRQGQGGVYVLTKKIKGKDVVVRTGITNDFARRKGEHAVDPELGKLTFEIVVPCVDYDTCRGLEDILYDTFPEAQKGPDDNPGEGKNKIRPMSDGSKGHPEHPARTDRRSKAGKYFDSLMKGVQRGKSGTSPSGQPK